MAVSFADGNNNISPGQPRTIRARSEAPAVTTSALTPVCASRLLELGRRRGRVQRHAGCAAGDGQQGHGSLRTASGQHRDPIAAAQSPAMQRRASPSISTDQSVEGERLPTRRENCDRTAIAFSLDRKHVVEACHWLLHQNTHQGASTVQRLA